MEEIVVDGKRILHGMRFPVELFREGGDLNFDWSAPIPDDSGGSYQVVKLLELSVVAMKFQPITQLTLFFPAGAVVLVLRGRIMVADQCSESNGKQKFGYPMHLLSGSEGHHIRPKTYGNLVSDSSETVFMLFQPGGMLFQPLVH